MRALPILMAVAAVTNKAVLITSAQQFGAAVLFSAQRLWSNTVETMHSCEHYQTIVDVTAVTNKAALNTACRAKLTPMLTWCCQQHCIILCCMLCWLNAMLAQILQHQLCKDSERG